MYKKKCLFNSWVHIGVSIFPIYKGIYTTLHQICTEKYTNIHQNTPKYTPKYTPLLRCIFVDIHQIYTKYTCILLTDNINPLQGNKTTFLAIN